MCPDPKFLNFLTLNFFEWVSEQLFDELSGIAKSKMRKDRFCTECLKGLDYNMSDMNVCNYLGSQSIKWCGNDSSCRVDYATFIVNGCGNTCKNIK